MSKVKLLIILMVIPALTFAQQTAKMNGPVISVADTLSLGEINLDELTDENGKVQIKVKNEGTSPLILRNVTGCCGTNIKEWPKAPILPGKDGIIKIEFRTEPRAQVISRTVTIESNAVNRKIVKVAITGVVLVKQKSNEITL